MSIFIVSYSLEPYVLGSAIAEFSLFYIDETEYFSFLTVTVIEPFSAVLIVGKPNFVNDSITSCVDDHTYYFYLLKLSLVLDEVP